MTERPHIHPSAVVHPAATLGDRVVVEPYAIVEEHVTVGARTHVGAHTVIRSNTTIGADNRIHPFCSIGDAPQHLGYGDEPTHLIIGDGNIIREYCTLNRGTAAGRGTTAVGDHNFLMAYTHIAHDCTLGDHTVFANGASIAGHVEVGDHAILGGFTLVHQFCRIGAHCITAIGAACFKDVPPYMIAAGNAATPRGINTKGLRRRDFSAATITRLRQAYRLLYRSHLDVRAATTAMAQLGDGADPHVAHLCEFVRASARGIIR